MATEFLNDARKEIEGGQKDFYGELKSILSGATGEAEQNLMEQTNPAFLQSLRLRQKKTAAAGTDGGYGDAEPARHGGL